MKNFQTPFVGGLNRRIRDGHFGRGSVTTVTTVTAVVVVVATRATTVDVFVDQRQRTEHNRHDVQRDGGITHCFSEPWQSKESAKETTKNHKRNRKQPQKNHKRNSKEPAKRQHKTPHHSSPPSSYPEWFQPSKTTVDEVARTLPTCVRLIERRRKRKRRRRRSRRSREEEEEEEEEE